MTTKRNLSEDAIEATVKTICLFWAKRLGNDFHPARDVCHGHLTQAQADRFELDMQYLWTYAADPYGSATKALISTHSTLYRSFDSLP